MSLIKKAKRSETWLKLGVTGPSGSGKTYGALLLASGINNGNLSKTVVLDTENGSANLYDSLGDYSVLSFEPPFHPNRYIKAIELCVKEGFTTIIMDSVSHEWNGSGGCLEIHAKYGGKFQDWDKVTPLHNAFIDAILQAQAHVICTLRRKQDYAMVEVGGRMKVEKMGLKEIQRDGFEYELTVNFDVNMEHMALASKDRTGLFMERTPFKITKEIGLELFNWSKGE